MKQPEIPAAAKRIQQMVETHAEAINTEMASVMAPMHDMVAVNVALALVLEAATLQAARVIATVGLCGDAQARDELIEVSAKNLRRMVLDIESAPMGASQSRH